MTTSTNTTSSNRGVRIDVESTAVTASVAVDALIDRLGYERGALLSSSYEYPGRYKRWEMGFTNPMLAITSRGQRVSVDALNERGCVVLAPVAEAIAARDGVIDLEATNDTVSCRIERAAARFEEEDRSSQPSTFSVIRAIMSVFEGPDPHLGLYGAFGYDLAFQFEPIELLLPRPQDQRDLVLYLPDQLLIVDHEQREGQLLAYEFTVGDRTTAGLERTGAAVAYEPDLGVESRRDHEPGGYAEGVRKAREYFARGDLFEVVTSQTFVEPCPEPPSDLFRQLKEQNPSPYGFIINLGADEWLVGASPEMYVRVEGTRVETCPISGTIARGRDPLDDASQILALLNSEKDESELTMCTDVDRNDKSRICVPGSVKVIGRRQIELYSRLIHTVDHVEGRLREGMDALDAFLTHAWAVTVTGAPKTKAMMFLEAHERSPRAWYGGAIGKIGFDGSLNTGLTLRTIRIIDGHAEVRVGATLLWDSIPEDEEAETELKASAFIEAVRTPVPKPTTQVTVSEANPRRVLLIDHMDSFVHTLGDYFRQTGAQVTTRRVGFELDKIAEDAPDLVVMSPGPGRPLDFAAADTARHVVDLGIALFGVCLGLQAIVEAGGGELGQLETPMHGKPSVVTCSGAGLFEGLPTTFKAGRYHSLYATRDLIPDVYEVTAVSDDGIVMAIEHRTLPLAAVQFHPESIMSMDDDVGMRLIRNVVDTLR